jgi:hypothetical protein
MASALVVVGRCSLLLHVLLHPNHPALPQHLLVRWSSQRKHFFSVGRPQLL